MNKWDNKSVSLSLFLSLSFSLSLSLSPFLSSKINKYNKNYKKRISICILYYILFHTKELKDLSVVDSRVQKLRMKKRSLFFINNSFRTISCYKPCAVSLKKHLKNLFILARGEGRQKEREREIDVREKHRLVVSGTCPNQGLNLQPRHVPWPGIEPVTLRFVGWCPTNWATLARANFFNKN